MDKKEVIKRIEEIFFTPFKTIQTKGNPIPIKNFGEILFFLYSEEDFLPKKGEFLQRDESSLSEKEIAEGLIETSLYKIILSFFYPDMRKFYTTKEEDQI